MMQVQNFFKFYFSLCFILSFKLVKMRSNISPSFVEVNLQILGSLFLCLVETLASFKDGQKCLTKKLGKL